MQAESDIQKETALLKKDKLQNAEQRESTFHIGLDLSATSHPIDHSIFLSIHDVSLEFDGSVIC